MIRGLFFTGTDTNVGKTYVTCAVARLLRGQGQKVMVSKPVATGAINRGGRLVSEDTKRLAEAAGQSDLAEITPWSLTEPAAPPLAARLAGVSLRLPDIVTAVKRRFESGAILLVEGVGGLLCPLTEEATVADLASPLRLPLVIVARRGLGTLNHTLLTYEAACRRGLAVAGVVVNETSPVSSRAEQDNVAELARLGVPILAVMPYGGQDLALAQVDWRQLAEAVTTSDGN